MEQDPRIRALLDAVARAVGMLTLDEAHAQQVCCICRQPADESIRAGWSEAGRAEYAISACCEACFDQLFGGENA